MTDPLRAFLAPLYQDLDGISRLEEIDRISSIARRLHHADEFFERLLLFHGLGRWLEKVGNRSRTSLATGIPESELRAISASIRRLDDPQTGAERAIAAARLIDTAGVRGLAERFARARREGESLMDVVRDVLADSWIPEWLPENGRAWLEQRHEARRAVCKRLLTEIALDDIDATLIP
ncbi:MAG TPA: hypothetical protein VII75_12840 [Thermoanaerobaculia bacterium]